MNQKKKLTSKWGLVSKLFGRNETKGSCVDMWIVITTNKIDYKNSIGAQDGQKQDCVKITSVEEELITIWCEVVQGNVNFHYSIHVWTVHSHATVVSLVELSKNFTHILWSCATYPVYFTRFWLGTRAWTSLPKNCFWNCYKTQSKYQWVNWNSTYVEKI